MDCFHILSIVARYFLLILIPIVASAENLSSNSNPNPYSVSLDMGVTKPNNLGNSTAFPLGYSTFIYDSNNNNQSVLISGISFNKMFTITSLYQLQLGISYHYISPMNATGNIEQGISLPYYQSAYSYSINSSQYLIETKLQHQFLNHYFPYVYVGLGLASNNAYNYATTAPNYLVVTPEYQNKRTNSFTYSLGLGADYSVTKKISVGLGYRFTDLGAVGLGPGTIRNTQVGQELKQSHLYMNTLLVQLIYFI